MNSNDWLATPRVGAGLLGIGSATNATTATAAAITGAHILSDPRAGQMFHHYIEHYPETINAMIYHASVEKAENGYILKVIHKQGEVPRQYVATTPEELQRVFIAAIVAERVSK